jgi:hypothetical protein
MNLKYICFVIFLLALTNCKENSSKCEKFELDFRNIKYVELTNKGTLLRKFETTNKIDSIISSLEKSCSRKVKFSSYKHLNFYNNDSLVYKIFISDNLFKSNGVVYKFNNKTVN